MLLLTYSKITEISLCVLCASVVRSQSPSHRSTTSKQGKIKE